MPFLSLFTKGYISRPLPKNLSDEIEMEKDKLLKLMLKASFVCHHAHTYMCMNFNVIEFVLRKSFEWRNKFGRQAGRIGYQIYFNGAFLANVLHMSVVTVSSFYIFLCIFIVKCDLRFGFRRAICSSG